jgi:hypothetical protein
VQAGMRAWSSSLRYSKDRSSTRVVLQKLLDFEAKPLNGTVSRQGKTIQIRLTNATNKEIIIAKRPADIDCWATDGVASFKETQPPAGKGDYVTLKPGDTYDVTLSMRSETIDEPKRVDLYWHLGRDFGLRAWTGCLQVNGLAP